MKNMILLMLLTILTISCKSGVDIARKKCLDHKGVSFVKYNSHGHMKIECNDGTTYSGDVNNITEDKK